MGEFEETAEDVDGCLLEETLLDEDLFDVVTEEDDGFWEGISGTEVIVGTVGFISKKEFTGDCCSYLLDAPSTIF